MKRAYLLGSAALALGAISLPALHAAIEPDRGSAPASQQRSQQPRLPGFAAELAQQPPITGPDAWRTISDEDAWRRLARVVPSERQQARFDYARSLIRAERGAEALGVLDVMRQDDPDLAMVDNFRLARGAALVLLGRADDAMVEMLSLNLASNPEACIWRMRALSSAGLSEQAFEQMRCAAPAFPGRPQAPFRLAAARAAVESGQPGYAIKWLVPLPDRDPDANLLRGRANIALGQFDEARLRFARVERSGNKILEADARLSQIEADAGSGKIPVGEAIKRLDALRFVWRGDHIEERALRLSYRLNSEKGDLDLALNAGATLMRFFDASQQEADFLPSLQAKLLAALAPDSTIPLEQAAGLYWEYRDLSPSGAEGDLLVARLADRLQKAGLYARAADLLEYQLFKRSGDLARGALSSRVASLHILSGRADRALDVLKRSADPSYPDPMQHARKRVEAAALTHLSRANEALAVLQDVPGSTALQTEILWKQRDWNGLAAKNTAMLPAPRGAGLSDVEQTIVLRHAIALAMLGQEEQLAGLRTRYTASFAGLKTASVFQMLTGAPGSVEADKLASAMAALPGASAAGELADLLEPVSPARAR